MDNNTPAQEPQTRTPSANSAASPSRSSNDSSSNDSSSSQTLSLTPKIFFIGFIMVLLLIPGFMIRSLILKRQSMMRLAQDEVSRMWGGEQHLTGPVISIPYVQLVDDKGKTFIDHGSFILLPEELTVDGTVDCKQHHRGFYDTNVYTVDLTFGGTVDCEQRHCGFYDTNVYTAELTFGGTFDMPRELVLLASNPKYRIDWSAAAVSMGISDLRGIEECIEIGFDDRQLPTVTESNNACFDIGVAARFDATGWAAVPSRRIPYRIVMKIKGSKNLAFAPVGNQNDIRIVSDCTTPSFNGNFLPSMHEENAQGFEAQWKVVAQNRAYPQLLTYENVKLGRKIAESELGIDFLIPVTQYQQAMRAVKYAALIIVLTFIGVFFVEMISKHDIHAFQYLLVGLALILFYSLLVSISEHIGFGWAYLIAAAMTTTLIALYMYGILHKETTALGIGGALTGLYLYVYTLLQLEAYALLAGSIGLFCILAVIMYYSRKIEWGRPAETDKNKKESSADRMRPESASKENE